MARHGYAKGNTPAKGDLVWYAGAYYVVERVNGVDITIKNHKYGEFLFLVTQFRLNNAKYWEVG